MNPASYIHGGINSVCAPLDSRLHVGAMVKVLDCHAEGRGFETRAGAFICQKKVFSVISSSGFDGTKCAFCSQC